MAAFLIRGPRRTVTSRAGKWRRLRLAALSAVFAVASGFFCPMLAWCAGQLDDEVKAAFILRFTEFIEWPDRPGTQRDPWLICVLGDHPIAPLLARMTTDYTVKGRKIEVRLLERVEDTAACQVVYVPDYSSAQMPAVRQVLLDRPVLVVTNGPGLAQAGAAINLFRDDERLRFEINPATLEGAGLKASSRLLRLAVIRESP
jgi:hypothetical protein